LTTYRVEFRYNDDYHPAWLQNYEREGFVVGRVKGMEHLCLNEQHQTFETEYINVAEMRQIQMAKQFENATYTVKEINE
jgi:hypothetical protein